MAQLVTGARCYHTARFPDISTLNQTKVPMLTDPQPTQAQLPTPKSPLKNPILYSSLALLAVLLYVLWIFFSRWQENRQLQRRATEERSQKQLDADRQTIDQLGGKELAIQSCYASAGIIHPGETLQ